MSEVATEIWMKLTLRTKSCTSKEVYPPQKIVHPEIVENNFKKVTQSKAFEKYKVIGYSGSHGSIYERLKSIQDTYNWFQIPANTIGAKEMAQGVQEKGKKQPEALMPKIWDLYHNIIVDTPQRDRKLKYKGNYLFCWKHPFIPRVKNLSSLWMTSGKPRTLISVWNLLNEFFQFEINSSIKILKSKHLNHLANTTLFNPIGTTARWGNPIQIFFSFLRIKEEYYYRNSKQRMGKGK